MREACCRSNRCSPLSSDDPSVLEPAAPAAPTSPSRPRRLTVLRVLPLAARSPCPALLDGSGQGGASWADLANAWLYCGSGLLGRHPFVGGKPNLNFHSGTKFHFNRCAFFTLSGGAEEYFVFVWRQFSCWTNFCGCLWRDGCPEMEELLPDRQMMRWRTAALLLACALLCAPAFCAAAAQHVSSDSAQSASAGVPGRAAACSL